MGMGKKISWEDAESLGSLKKEDSIFAPTNKYGYKIAINHPLIKPLYDRYKRKLGEHILSDAQRLEFERIILEKLARGIKKDE